MGQNLPFTDDDLRRAAGPMSYARGVGYLDQVEELVIAGAWVSATVSGNDQYRVRLSFSDKRGGWLRGDCSCPFGAEGNFCKHCVATGLAALRSSAAAQVPAAPAAVEAEPGSLVSWLTSLSRDELLIELLDLLADEPELFPRLQLRAAARRVDAESVRDAVARLIRVSDYVDHDEASAYARDVIRAAAAIEELIDAGAAAAAIDVARDAIEWLRQSFGVIDDSSGDVGNAGYELLDVHLLACQEARPDPVELAGYLADLCLTGQWGLSPAFGDYVELLGDSGTAALRERVAAAYEANPGAYRLREQMESVLEIEGDVDALVAFLAAHLDQRGSQHVRIAQTLDKAGRADEALDWAERGVRESQNPEPRLVDYVVDRYTAAARADDVLSLRRMLFRNERTLASYQALRSAATECGVWDAERKAALERLREDAAAVRGNTLWYPWSGPVLIDALLDDGDIEGAWNAAPGVASESQWIRLANASVSSRPADALAVFRRVIKGLTQNTGNAVYHQIAQHLLAARACHEALGTMDEFRQYMVVLRMGQKRKRNLIQILDDSGL
jgi:tetratricopeptide (TPR) repeat protein